MDTPDVVGLLDSSGPLVVEYKYDAWGKPLSTTGSLADTLGKRNPFRYRGYVYDEEMEFYYLQSRFYSSKLVHFLNSDDVVHLSSHCSLKNAFSYCNLRPIMQKDKNGYIPEYAAEELIRENVNFIIEAAEEFDVDSQILAGVIYDEQTLNVDTVDTLTD